MNGYVCMWENKKIEVYADTSYQAQTLAEKDGKQIVHSTGGL